MKSIWEIKSKPKDLSLVSAVLDSSMDGIVALKAVRNREGFIVDFEYSIVNAKAAELLKRYRSKLIGKKLLEEFPGMKEQGLFTRYADVVETGETLNTEEHFAHDDFDNWFRIIAVKLGDGVVTTFADTTRVKAGEKKSKRNAALIEKVFDSTSDSLVLLKPVRSDKGVIIDFQYILLNNQAEKTLNRSAESVVGKTVSSLYPATQSRGILDLYIQAFNDGKEFDTEFNYDADGLNNWFRQRGVKLENELLVITTDITRIKKAEREITDRNKFILRIADSSPGLLYLFDLRTNKNLYINKRIEELLGYTPEYIKQLGNDFLESMIHPYDQAAHGRHRSSIYKAKDREVLTIDYRLRHMHGKWVWFRVYETVFERDDDGLPIIVVGVAENISARKESEDEMLKLKCLVDNSSDLIGIASMEGYIQYLNSAGKKMVGIESSDQVKRSHILDYFLPKDREYVQSTILPIVREQGRWSGEINFRNFKTSVAIPVIWNVFLVEDTNENPIGIACVSHDRSYRKQQDEQLEQSESKFRMLFEKSSDGIMLIERNRVIDCNQTARTVFGTGNSDMILKHYLWDLSPTYQRDGRLSVEKAEEVMQKAIGGSPQKLEWTFRKNSGELFTTEILFAPVAMGSQQIIQLLWRMP